MNKILKSLILLFVFMSVTSASEAKLNLFQQPRYVPDLSFYGDSGKPYKLKTFGADLLVAVVWSRRCGPCLADLKPLNDFALATADGFLNKVVQRNGLLRVYQRH